MFGIFRKGDSKAHANDVSIEEKASKNQTKYLKPNGPQIYKRCLSKMKRHNHTIDNGNTQNV